MCKKTLKNSLKTFIAILAFILAVFSVFSLAVFSNDVKVASASSVDVVYTDVLEDLQKDESFDVAGFPVVLNDYSINVIQIAESANSELFIYTYQPSANLATQATLINISTAINDSLKYYNYDLELLNSNDVFFKYKVVDFVVKADALRYYDISNIYRAWNKDFDNSADNENVISGVAFGVGQLWTASTVEGNVSYSCTKNETVEITDKYVGYVRYSLPSSILYDKAVDNHFVAFSTNYEIDKLLEADIYYITRDYEYHKTIWGEKTTYSNSKSAYQNLTYTDRVENPSNGWVKYEYSWDKIDSVEHFIKKEELTSEVEKQLENKQWVLRFLETDYNNDVQASSIRRNGTEVQDVTILRLKFEIDEETYNLGVVDNMQGEVPGQEPSGGNIVGAKDWFTRLIEWLKNVWTNYWPYIIAGLAVIAWPFLIRFFIALYELFIE